MQALPGLFPGNATAAATLIVVAHPDDETLGLGGQLPMFENAFLVHVTDGAPRYRSDRVSYARIRRDELEKALKMAGFPLDRCLQFGVVDQECHHHFAQLSRRLEDLICVVKPATIFTHPYEGGHPDHDSCAFIVNSAINLARLTGHSGSRLLEFTSYYNSSPWDVTASLKTGSFLSSIKNNETIIRLSDKARDLKLQMLDAFTSQREMIANFGMEEERIRVAPTYDFTRPPHDGTLFYEAQGWALSGREWRALAEKAGAELGLPARHAASAFQSHG